MRIRIHSLLKFFRKNRRPAVYARGLARYLGYKGVEEEEDSAKVLTFLQQQEAADIGRKLPI